MNPIVIWNREKNQAEVEQVYGEKMVDLLYGTTPGQKLADWILAGRVPSVLYGAYQSSGLSKHKIGSFIRDFRIPMDEYVDPGFRSFNDFFIRQFRPGARTFVQDENRMPAFAEARYLAWDRVEADQVFPVKGKWLSAEALLECREGVGLFKGGPLIIARLCPVDYHRFHFPDDGEVVQHYQIAGKLHSVNPKALKFKGEIFATNERHVTLLKTKHFGMLAYIEVGALCVGRIVQSHPLMHPYKRGDEKGYFLFGGSTVIVMGEPGAWRPDDDLLRHTAEKRETLVKLGQPVAASLRR